MAKGKYKEWLTADGLLRLNAWARDGLFDDQIAHNIGINRATLYDWKKRYPDIDNALKRGKELIDVEVENAVLKRALGYEAIDERTEISDKHGRKIIKTTRHIPPDPVSCFFWLKHRMPDKWLDKQVASKDDEQNDSGVVLLPEVMADE